MTTLAVALLFTFTVRATALAVDSPEAPVRSTARLRLIGALSMVMWITVAAAGRWIGFS
jgi:hypothetical protein